MFGIGKLRGEKNLIPSDAKIALKSGLLLIVGNGLVCLAEESIPSGLTAIIIGTSPISIMLLNWLFFEKLIPSKRQIFGILLSFVGIVFLTKGETHGANSNELLGVLALIIAVVSWGIGSLFQRRAGKLPNIFTFSAYQLISGSVLLGILGLLRGELNTFDASKITNEGIFAVLYLIVFGSVVAFSSFIWLNRNVEPSKVATYAVVNPVVAVWLGWLFLGEQIDMNTILYSFVVLIGIYFVIFSDSKKKALAKKLEPKSLG